MQSGKFELFLHLDFQYLLQAHIFAKIQSMGSLEINKYLPRLGSFWNPTPQILQQQPHKWIIICIIISLYALDLPLRVTFKFPSLIFLLFSSIQDSI